MIPVLITRPQADAERTGDRLRGSGFRPVIAPMLEIRYRDDYDLYLDDVQALLLTSANGARAAARATMRRDVPVLAVGDRTAEAAREATFDDVRSAGGDAAALSALAAKTLDPAGGAILHIRGRDIRRSPLDALGDFDRREAVLYTAEGATALPRTALTALRAGAAFALFYSTRTADVFAHLTREIDLSALTAIGLSEAALEPLDGRDLAARSVARAPNEDALLEALRAASR